jgi:hypothetical protein
MLKPVTILALDDDAATLAEAVQRRVAAAHGLDDLVQWRRADDALTEAIDSIHVQRQRPESPLRARDDVSTRELVLVVVSAAGPARTTLLDSIAKVRALYDMRRLATFFSIEVLCVLPEVTGTTKEDDYAAAYGVLKALSGADPKPFDEAWLLDATNSNRVKFGTLPASLDAYADAVAGALTFEPEMSGALPGQRPRGLPPAFSSFGCADLVFPRDAALRRLEPRFAAELYSALCGGGNAAADAGALAAKQFVVREEFVRPVSRIGLDAGQSLFRRFQPKTLVTEKTRSADEVIAGARAELQQHRDSVHLRNLQTIEEQREATAGEIDALLSRVVDETLDRHDYATAITLLDALIDPLPDVRNTGDIAPRNVVTELRAATAALDARLHFVPNTAASDAGRKRLRELSAMLEDQTLVAQTVASQTSDERLAALRKERESLLQQLPEIVFAEEGENNAARNAAREAEVARLAGESEAKEQQLRELFAQKPRAEHALREALEARRVWLWHQVAWAVAGVAVIFAVPYAFEILWPHLRQVTWTAAGWLGLFGAFAGFRYATAVAPRVREARESLARLIAQIEATDKAKNAACNDELQFEHDLAHRRATIAVLRHTREKAKETRDALSTRRAELERLAIAAADAGIPSNGLAVAIVDEADVDAWYERTLEDRKPFIREFPVTRSASRHLSMDDLRGRVDVCAAKAFAPFRALTLATAAATVAAPAKLTQRLKRFSDFGAPLIELRDDDIEAQRSMQRDSTLWADDSDAPWLRQLRDRFPDAHVKSSTDKLHVHVTTRVLHYPAFVIGQIDYYRAQHNASAHVDATGFPDLLPSELVVTGILRTAYEQVLLGRALGVLEVTSDGTITTGTSVLGDSNLAAAQRLAAADGATLRRNVHQSIEPKLTAADNVARGLRKLLDDGTLTTLDRGIAATLVRRYDALV